MSTFGWDQMTDWWDEKLGDEGDLWHRALIDPPLLHLVGEVSGLHLLDLACGNGYLSPRFARQGAIVTSVDGNAPLIERARAREDLEGHMIVSPYTRGTASGATQHSYECLLTGEQEYFSRRRICHL